MRRVKEIKRQILTLSEPEFSALRDWLLALDTSQWDAQVQSDVCAGQLDDLAHEALLEQEAGQSRRFPSSS